MTQVFSPNSSAPTPEDRTVRRFRTRQFATIILAILSACVGAACLTILGPLGSRTVERNRLGSPHPPAGRVVVPGAGEPIKPGDRVTILVKAGGPAREMTGTVPHPGKAQGPTTFFHGIDGMRVGETRETYPLGHEISVLRREP
jgi:hypothetical protein